jgi:rare lipoprotein A
MPSYQAPPSSSGFVQQGLASWYGGKFHGRTTANGERFDMYRLTAAHKTLPFDTRVRVTNLQNGRDTLVRINDRGPFVRGRIIDLSYGAARGLGMVEDGVVPVRIEALGRGTGRVGQPVKPHNYEWGDFTVQVGAFIRPENALRLRSSLRPRYRHATLSVFYRGPQRFYRVQVGQYSRLGQARDAARKLQAQGYADAFVVARDR